MRKAVMVMAVVIIMGLMELMVVVVKEVTMMGMMITVMYLSL